VQVQVRVQVQVQVQVQLYFGVQVQVQCNFISGVRQSAQGDRGHDMNTHVFPM